MHLSLIETIKFIDFN